jgi:hypothetical protein
MQQAEWQSFIKLMQLLLSPLCYILYVKLIKNKTGIEITVLSHLFLLDFNCCILYNVQCVQSTRCSKWRRKSEQLLQYRLSFFKIKIYMLIIEVGTWAALWYGSKSIKNDVVPCDSGTATLLLKGPVTRFSTSVFHKKKTPSGPLTYGGKPYCIWLRICRNIWWWNRLSWWSAV